LFQNTIVIVRHIDQSHSHHNQIDFLRGLFHIETFHPEQAAPPLAPENSGPPVLAHRRAKEPQMSTHRSTRPRVSNETTNSNFEAGTALENLRAEVVEIEALARAAEAAADALPAPTTDRQRIVFGRIQSLATKTSEQASASLHFANAQVAALTAQMEARRKAATR
jgi:hypothetical protein